MLNRLLYYSFLLITLPTILHSHTVDLKSYAVDEKTLQLKATFNLDEHEFLYKDSVNFSIDLPELELSAWRSNQEAVNQYDQVSKETKPVFTGNPTFMLYANKLSKNIDDQVSLYITYQLNTQTSPHQAIFPINTHVAQLQPALQKKTATEVKKSNRLPTLESKNEQPPSRKTTSWSDKVSNLVKHTQSLPIRLVLVFLLGILMSLTPCIYPMIPITAGILHAQKGSSFIYNVCLSLSYTLGLSTTFACFGLLAGYSGAAYGKLLAHPLVVLLLVGFLLYLAFSMFGFYDLHIPRFLQTNNTPNGSGSLWTTFLFGAASGTIASPCVSPGLILLLSIVATMGNVVLGFLLLFFFGVGLSTPLLIVGTFSSSLASLPRAGMWMVEIKKFFGIMLISVALYYLQALINAQLLMLIGALLLAACGLYYFYNAQSSISNQLKKFNNLAGFIFLTCSIVVFTNTYQVFFYKIDTKTITWHTDYELARKKALSEKKLLFIDCWADFCSVCKAINNTLLKNEHVVNELERLTIAVSANGTDEAEEPYKTIKKKFNVVGFPTFLLIDPLTESIIQSYNSELYHVPAENFIVMIKEHSA